MKEPLSLSEAVIEEAVEKALQEDLPRGDITTQPLIDPSWKGRGLLRVKAEGVLAGLPLAARVFQKVDASLVMKARLQDGQRVRPGDVVAVVEGAVASILQGERVALNFLQHLSGIATETARYVAEVAGMPARILDTRKTIPGLRALEKYAVRAGGGYNHRMSLSDAILIKDNHLAALRAHRVPLKEAIARLHRTLALDMKVEVEVGSLEEAKEALEAGADLLLLDNMSVEGMRQVVAWVAGRVRLEASGGMTLDRVRAVAETGVDFISVGALTHSARALDISLDLEITG